MQAWMTWVLGIVALLLGAGVADTISYQRDLARDFGSLSARMSLMEDGKSTPKAKDTIEALDGIRRELGDIRALIDTQGKSIEIVAEGQSSLRERVGRLEGRAGTAKQSSDSSKVRPAERDSVRREPLAPFDPKPPAVLPSEKIGG